MWVMLLTPVDCFYCTSRVRHKSSFSKYEQVLFATNSNNFPKGKWIFTFACHCMAFPQLGKWKRKVSKTNGIFGKVLLPWIKCFPNIFLYDHYFLYYSFIHNENILHPTLFYSMDTTNALVFSCVSSRCRTGLRNFRWMLRQSLIFSSFEGRGAYSYFIESHGSHFDWWNVRLASCFITLTVCFVEIKQSCTTWATVLPTYKFSMKERRKYIMVKVKLPRVFESNDEFVCISKNHVYLSMMDFIICTLLHCWSPFKQYCLGDDGANLYNGIILERKISKRKW